MNNNNILYIGNDLTKQTGYKTSMDVLVDLLIKEGHLVLKTSNKKSIILRLIDMCFSILWNSKKIDYIIIDIFSSTYFYGAFLTSQLARVLKIKHITVLRGGNLPSRIEKSKLMSDLIFTNSYRNIAPSNYLKVAFEKQGYPTEFIPNILNIENYNFKLRKKIKPKVLWVRAFRQLYNPTMAIEVLKLLKENYPDAELCMVGPFKDSSIDEVKYLVKKYKLKDSVEFTGVLQKQEWIKKAEDFDVFINTTNFDNTPVSVMEAMALGLVVVSTNAGGMPYLIESKKDGILVAKNDVRTMAQEIISVVKGKYPLLAENARNKAETFSSENVMVKWNKILQ